MISRTEALQAIARHDREIGERLRSSQAGIETAATALREANEIRAGVIGEAAADGWTNERIGAALGVSHQRVAQIRQSAV